MKIRLLDIVAVVLVAAAVFFSSLLVYGESGGTLTVVIDSGDGRRYYPIEENRTVMIEGPIGTTEIIIEGSRVRIRDSPCNNKTCVLSGSVGAAGAWVACLPNKVFVSVEGRKSEEDIDARAW